MLVTADLHLTDKPQDEYRWAIFPWLKEQVVKYKQKYVYILGDITDAKDRHSSVLVNRIVKEISILADLTEVVILKGNHDYTDPNNPFFHFLTRFDNVHFISKITLLNSGLLFLPHTHSPEKEWTESKVKIKIREKAKFIFIHQTMNGAIASNGVKLKGLDTSFFKRTKAKIISGDIHVPQKIGPVEYVGSPYHIHFGDSFKPRVLLIKEDGSRKDLYFPCIQKHMLRISSPDELRDNSKLRKGDQVKVKLRLTRSEFTDWTTKKREVVVICKELGFDLFGVELEQRVRERLGDVYKEIDPSTEIEHDTKDCFERFCKQEKIDKYRAKVGKNFLKEGE